MIFTFGSNEAGRHGAGAALTALRSHGAVLGVGNGPQGRSYGIPTKNMNIKTLPIFAIEQYVNEFIAYAEINPETGFQVTRIGCGLAGLKDEDIAPMFVLAPKNCFFDLAWRDHLPEEFEFWGTYD